MSKSPIAILVLQYFFKHVFVLYDIRFPSLTVTCRWIHLYLAPLAHLVSIIDRLQLFYSCSKPAAMISNVVFIISPYCARATFIGHTLMHRQLSTIAFIFFCSLSKPAIPTAYPLCLSLHHPIVNILFE